MTDFVAARHDVDELADVDSEFELAVELAEQDRLVEAEAAFARADEMGHPAAAHNLAVLLEERGEIAGAAAAYQRAYERGDSNGAFGLAMLLADQNRLAEAEEWLAARFRQLGLSDVRIQPLDLPPQWIPQSPTIK